MGGIVRLQVNWVGRLLVHLLAIQYNIGPSWNVCSNDSFLSLFIFIILHSMSPPLDPHAINTTYIKPSTSYEKKKLQYHENYH